MTEIPSGAHFVFVHGAFHGAWCWYKIRCLLESVGHKVTCIDLPCAGIDPTDPNTVFSFQEFNKTLDNVLMGLAEDEKVILVGHSVGGSNVTASLYSFPEKIQVAVYLVASMKRKEEYLINQDNDTLLYGGRYSNETELYEYVYGEGPNEPPTSLMIKNQFQRQRFYQRSPLEDSTLAGMLLKPVPIQALKGEPYGGKDVSKVPRVFIKTLEDNTVAPEVQDDMIAKWQPSDIYSINSDHSAFFSAPVELFGILHEVATKYSYGSSSQGSGASNQKTSYANCMEYSSFFEQEDKYANGRVIRGRQKMQKFGNEWEQIAVSIDKVIKENNETRQTFSRLYNGLKILMLLSVWMVIALLFILATKA